MSSLFSPDLFFRSIPLILSRLHITLAIVIVSLLIGIVIGTGLAAVRLYKIPILSQLAASSVSFIRGIPILVLLFIAYIGLPLAVGSFGLNINRWDTLFFVMIAYIVNTAAFLSEVIRSAVAGVDKGQTEAAYSVGLTAWQTFYRIVAPQATRIALPAFGNVVVSLLKDTSLAYTLGVIDVIGVINAISSNTHRSLEAYTAAAGIFFVLSTLLEGGFHRLELRWGVMEATSGTAKKLSRELADKA